MRFVHKLLFAAAIGAGVLASVALAAGPQGSAETILAEVEKDPANKDLTADAVKRSREAMDRAKRMRAAGDETHAKLADALALRWARVAQDLKKTTDSESTAANARRDAIDAGAEVERERSMLEQQLAENGRLTVELSQFEKDGGRPASAPAKDAGVKNADAPTPPKGKDGGK